MSKKLFAAVLVLALLCTGAFTIFAGSFTDVPADAYYAAAAERMAARGILSGYGDGWYYGNHSVTRAQIAALACKMLGKVEEATALAGATAFTDVPKESWATGYVNYAHANGIVLGDGDGKFRPDDYVKYEEVVKVIVCVLELDEGVKIDPTDWSKEYLERAEKAGLLANLIGKKGTYMLRSDIAVITDAAMTVLDKSAAAESASSATTTIVTETTTKKPSRPTVTTTKVTAAPVVTTTPEPVVTTTPESVVTTAAPVVTTTPVPVVTTTPEPVVTTAAPVVTTTLEPVVTTTPEPVVTTTVPEETTTVVSVTTKEDSLPFLPF